MDLWFDGYYRHISGRVKVEQWMKITAPSPNNAPSRGPYL